MSDDEKIEWERFPIWDDDELSPINRAAQDNRVLGFVLVMRIVSCCLRAFYKLIVLIFRVISGT